MLTPTTSTHLPASLHVYVCFKCKESKEKVSHCARCHFAHYCSKECQKADWKAHKPKCSHFVGLSKKWTVANRAFQTKTAGDIRPHPYWNVFPKSNVFQYLQEPPYDEPGEGKLALDLGCGKAWSSRQLLRRGWKVVAIDYFSGPIDTAKKEMQAANEVWLAGGHLVMKQADVMTYAFPAGVSLVLAKDLLPYLDPKNIGILLRKIAASLVEGGYLMSSLFHHDSSCVMYGAWTIDGAHVVQNYLPPEFKLIAKRHRIKEGGSHIIDFVARKELPNSNAAAAG